MLDKLVSTTQYQPTIQYGVKQNVDALKPINYWRFDDVREAQLAASLFLIYSADKTSEEIVLTDFTSIFRMTLRLLKITEGWAK